jgi:type I restriction enzyme M protein
VQNHGINEACFLREVQLQVPDAQIDASKNDEKDQKIGIVGYEIPFNSHFYQYQPPCDLLEIDADLDNVSTEIMD